MSAEDQLQAARAAWADGNARSATAAGWKAVNDAMILGDRGVVADVGALADGIAHASGGKVAGDAAKLAEYCRLCLEGVGNGTQARSVLGRLIGRSRKRKCPDCAESISSEAKVCPHCRYRFPLEDPPASTQTDT